MKFNLHLMQFESVQAWWDYAKREPKLAANKDSWNKIKAGKLGRGVRWFGLNNASEVIQTAKTGWQDGAERVKGIAEEIKAQIPTPQSIRRRIKWSDQGDSLDIHRVWSGRLGQAWESHPRQRTNTQQSVTIFSQIFQSVMTHSDYGFYRGAAVIALSDLLTEAGYNVEIVGGMTAAGCIVEGDSRDDAYVWMVDIKSALAQLDLSSLAATLALAGFFRVGGFMLNVNYADSKGKQVDPSHGLLMYHDKPYYNAVQARIKESTGRGWDFDATECGSRREAIEWVKASIAKLQGQEEA